MPPQHTYIETNRIKQIFEDTTSVMNSSNRAENTSEDDEVGKNEENKNKKKLTRKKVPLQNNVDDMNRHAIDE